jgi:hypothetical protein
MFCSFDKFDRQRDDELLRELRILALLEGLDLVPEGFHRARHGAVGDQRCAPSPERRRQQELLMAEIALVGIVDGARLGSHASSSRNGDRRPTARRCGRLLRPMSWGVKCVIATVGRLPTDERASCSSGAAYPGRTEQHVASATYYCALGTLLRNGGMISKLAARRLAFLLVAARRASGRFWPSPIGGQEQRHQPE